MNRRRFHIVITYAVWAVMSLAAAVGALVYLLFVPKPKPEEDWVDATDFDSLPADVPEQVLFPRTRVDGWKVTVEKTKAWLVRRSDGGVTAFAPQCTHLGCAYHWDTKAGNFLCPCHSSRFSIDGAVIGGPAPRPLDQFAVKIDGQRVSLGALKKSA
jgi:menaquinol-cytochrome c reductase iron-sulfur subunit